MRIDSTSQVFINDRTVDDRVVHANLERKYALLQNAPLIVASHPDADTNIQVILLGSASMVGIDNISAATTH